MSVKGITSGGGDHAEGAGAIMPNNHLCRPLGMDEDITWDGCQRK